MKSSRHRRNALSITELLVVIAIASALMGLLIPAVQWARERARTTACAGHLKQIGLAFAQHEASHRDFPHAGLMDLKTPDSPWNLGTSELVNVGGGRMQEAVAWGWAYQILPYMDQQVIAQKHVYANPDGTHNSAVRLAAASEPIVDYFCPSRRMPVALPGTGCGRADGLRAALDYAGNGGWRNRLNGTQYETTPFPYPAAEASIHPDGAVIPAGFVDAFGVFRFERDRVSAGNLSDGAASTILVGERNVNRARMTYSLAQVTEDNGYMAGYTWDTIRWAYAPPRGDRNDPASDRDGGFGSSHPSGCNFLFGDGAVHFVDYEIDPAVFRQLSSRDDGQSPAIP